MQSQGYPLFWSRFAAKSSGADRRRLLLVALLGALLLAGAQGIALAGGDGRDVLRIILLATGGTLLVLSAALAVGRWQAARTRRVALAVLRPVLQAEPVPRVLTDAADGNVLWCNGAAATWAGLTAGRPIADGLENWRAEPTETMHTLLDRVAATGRARLALPDGAGGQVLDLRETAGNMVLWRFFPGPVEAGQGDDGALPRLRLDRDGNPLAVNQSYLRRFGAVGPDTGATVGGSALCTGTKAAAFEGMAKLRLEVPAGASDLYFLDAADLATLGDPDAAVREFDRLPVGLIRLGPEGDIRAPNDEARRLLGLRAGEAASIDDVLDGPGRPVTDWVAEAHQGRGLNRTEVLRATRASVSDFLQVTLRKVSLEGDTTLFAVLSDATEFKELEDKFTQSQKMHAIGQLAGGVAHDFNNLLTAILGYCDLLLLRRDPTDPDYPDLMQIQQNSNRAASLVRQLLAFSRKQRMETEILDLGDTLRDLAHLLNRLLGERVTLTLVHGDGVGCIRTDRQQFEQVLINLVVNARDAMPLGGEIRIETRLLRLHHEERRDNARIPPGEYTVILVRDEGVGIPPDKLPKVFEPFFTTKRQGEGTGLGLSTVYGIVKQSGGFIFVDSTVGVGTTFALYFVTQASEPVAEMTPQTRSEPVSLLPEPEPVALRKGRILLVEDEAPVRSFTARALEMRGHTVIQADCGDAALELLADPGFQVDLFVSDVLMPGQDGPGWVARARAQRPDIGVIFVSGHAEDHLPITGMRIPNAVFLGKPYSLQQMTDLVDERLRAVPAEPGVG